MRERGKEAWLPWRNGLSVKPEGASQGGHIVSIGFQPPPASFFPAISPIPGVFEDSGKAPGLGRVRCRGRKDRSEEGAGGFGVEDEEGDEGWVVSGAGSHQYLLLFTLSQYSALPKKNLKIWVRGWG